MIEVGALREHCLALAGTIPDEEILEAVEESYRLVVEGLPKKHRPAGWESVGAPDQHSRVRQLGRRPRCARRTGREARRMQRLEEARDRLVALGAREIDRFEPGQEMSGGFLVMTDPEGNEFCLD